MVSGPGALVVGAVVLALLPAAWGFWWPLLAQATASVCSDYLFAGRDTLWHVADKLLAVCHAAFFVALSFLVLRPWEAPLLIAAPFACYFGGAAASRRRDGPAYARWHALWHLLGCLSLAYTTARACPAAFIFEEACVPSWRFHMRCACLTSGHSPGGDARRLAVAAASPWRIG